MIKNNLSQSLIFNILNTFLSGISLNKFEYKSIPIDYGDGMVYNHKYYCGYFSELLSSNFKIHFLLTDLNLNNNFKDYILILLIKEEYYIIGSIDSQDVFASLKKESIQNLPIKLQLKLCLDLETAIDLGWSWHSSYELEDKLMIILDKYLY